MVCPIDPLSEFVLSVEVIDNGDDSIVKYETVNMTLYKIRRIVIEGARMKSKAVPTDERKNSPINRFWEDFTDMGVYFYVGHNTDGFGLNVYIGKCGNVYDRFRTHRPDEWQEWTELVFVYRDRITVATRYKLEELCIALADGRSDVSLVNEKKRRKEKPTPMEFRMVRSVMNVLPHLMYVAGYDFLLERSRGEGERMPEPDRPRTKYIKDKDRSIYDSLIADGTLKDGVFTRDWLSDSPTSAARFITGSTNGAMWDRWKTADGKSVREFMREKE